MSVGLSESEKRRSNGCAGRDSDCGARCSQTYRRSGQSTQDEINTLRNTDLGQDRHLIAKGGIHIDQTPILCDGCIEVMPTFGIGHPDFRTRWRKKNAAMKPMFLKGRCQRWLTRQVLESGSHIDQAPVEEYPAAVTACFSKISEGKRDGAPREGDFVRPWQRPPVAKHLFLDDPTTRLLHRG